MNVLRKNTAEKFCSYAFLPVCTFLFFIFVSGISHGKGMPGSFSDLVEKLSPSVVNITTSYLEDSEGAQRWAQVLLSQLTDML